MFDPITALNHIKINKCVRLLVNTNFKFSCG